MGRDYKAVLQAVIAVVLLNASALAQPGPNGKATGPDWEAGFFQRLDSAFGSLDQAALRELEEQAGQALQGRLAGAAALFINGSFSAAMARLEGLDKAESPETARRAQELSDLISAWQSVFAGLVQIEGAGMVVHVPANQEKWGRQLPVMLVRWYSSYAGYFKPQDTRLPDIIFVPDSAALSALSRIPLESLQKSGTTATNVLGRIVLLSPSAFPHGYDWSRVVCHEMVHSVLYRKVGGGLPRFLEEGIATWLEEWARTGTTRPLSKSEVALLFMATNGQMFLEREALEQPYFQLESDVQARIVFLQTLFWVRVLIQRGGDDAVERLVEAVASGQDWEEAMQAVTGISVNAMFARAKGRWSNIGDRDGLDSLLFHQVPERLEPRERNRLEQSRKDVLLGDLLWGRGRRQAALEMYTQAPESLQHTPDLTWRLVRLYMDMQLPERAEELADRTRKLFPDDARVLYVSALVKKKKSKADAARLAHRAWLVNPFAIETISLFEELKVHLEDVPTGGMDVGKQE